MDVVNHWMSQSRSMSQKYEKPLLMSENNTHRYFQKPCLHGGNGQRGGQRASAKQMPCTMMEVIRKFTHCCQGGAAQQAMQPGTALSLTYHAQQMIGMLA